MTQRAIFTCDHATVLERDGMIEIHGTADCVYESRTIEAAANAMAWELSRLQSRIAELEGENAKLTSYKDTLCGLLDELTDTEECRYDHHDNCQSHNLHERPCPHETAKALLKKEYEA